MKIAILGTRGIPNNYGGFEQFAENLSVRLAEKGHLITVYNPHYHYYAGNNYKGVEIIKKYNPEKLLGASANYIYDYLCLLDALKKYFDIILECGAASASLSFYLCRLNNKIIITNPDGLEWKRKKWSLIGKKVIKLSEKLAIRKSPYIITDHPEISNYILKTYNKKSWYIPYGASIPESYNELYLKKYTIKPNQYSLIIARLIPENNIEVIIKGYINSKCDEPLIIVGITKTNYSKYLKQKYRRFKHIKFIGSIYDNDILNNLRHYCQYYFHGHSVGGTNPSLLEAMACGSFIIAQNNIFNKGVLKNGGYYFSTAKDITNCIKDPSILKNNKEVFRNLNFNNIRSNYNWDNIINQYESLIDNINNNH